jgi:hypothetical protein
MKKPRRPTAQDPRNEPKATSRRRVAEVLRLAKDARDELLTKQGSEPSDGGKPTDRPTGVTLTDKAGPGRPTAPKPAPRSPKRHGRARVLHNVLAVSVLVTVILLIGLPALLVFWGRPKEATAVALALISALTALAKVLLSR